VLRNAGANIGDEITKLYGGSYRVVVDSAPVLERALAARAQHGFIGKNTCFISANHGSFFLLAEILFSASLPDEVGNAVDPSKRSNDGGCGTCKRCQVNCPTGALDSDYRLDANRCISYWTIEHRGVVPTAIWPWFKHYYFGCDICQLACPYNRKATHSSHVSELKLKEQPPLADIATMDQNFYEATFGGTPMTRAKREGLMRNALIAMAVTNDPKLSGVLKVIAEDGAMPEVVQQTALQVQTFKITSN
jgi:epoxyqueuosine reductase